MAAAAGRPYQSSNMLCAGRGSALGTCLTHPHVLQFNAVNQVCAQSPEPMHGHMPTPDHSVAPVSVSMRRCTTITPCTCHKLWSSSPNVTNYITTKPQCFHHKTLKVVFYHAIAITMPLLPGNTSGCCNALQRLINTMTQSLPHLAWYVNLPQSSWDVHTIA